MGLKKKSVPVIIAALVIAVLILWLRFSKDPTGRLESITIGYPPFESATLYYVAEDRHFFSQNGLQVTSRKYDTGVATLDGILKGEADLAVGIAEFPVVGRAFQKAKIRILGSIDRAEFIYLVGRKDSGIEKASDLRGKRVGTTFGTVAHFHLGRFLNLHGVKMQDVTAVDVRTPEEWVDSVAKGDIDAIATAQPYADRAKGRLGANGVVWPAQSGQLLYGLTISSDEWVTNHPELAGKVLKSLEQAEEYLIQHPAEAKAIVQERLNLDSAYIETVWSQNQFSLSLDQALIATMEDEARWMIRNNLTRETNMPNFLDFIDERALKAIRPHAVTIIR